MNLQNKKVLITGSTGGIGNSLVQKFTDLGALVVASGTNEDKLNNIKTNFQRFQTEKFKLEHHDKIEKFIDQVDKKLNGLDILILIKELR